MTNIYSFFSSAATIGIIIIAVFSAIMFWDCINRKKSKFSNTFEIQNGEYDKIIWLLIIVLGMRLFGIGAFAYYLLIKKQTMKNTVDE
jgi:hypothetical protein